MSRSNANSAREALGAESAPLRRLGRYELHEQIGRGGMGVVYRAKLEGDGRDQKDRWVALKTLPRPEADEIFRFKQEFRSLADVVHPNLIALHELVAEGDQWFFTMELIEGLNFLEHLRAELSAGWDPKWDTPTSKDDSFALQPALLSKEPLLELPARRTCLEKHFQSVRSTLAQLVLGVMALHRAGKLHRDIKPSNVLVTTDGRVVLLDFGLVKELHNGPNGGESELQIAGTRAYMAPEQARGETLSETSDWYSVGVMLYETLTGTHPFGGQPPTLSQGHPISPRELLPEIPEDLETLCLRLLEYQATNRPDGHEILARLGVSADPQVPGLAGPAGLIFVGREAHLAALVEAQRSVEERRAPEVVFVHGQSGMGKTALLEHFLSTQARPQGAVVLEGRCYERESVAFKALDTIVDALTSYLLRQPALEVAELMPRDVPALVRLFPVLRRVRAVDMTARRLDTIPDPRELRRRAVIALRELLARLGDRKPLVLLIDDLQWGDTDSAALIEDLLRPPSPPALLLLASYRSEHEAKSACLQSLGRMRRRLERLDPAPVHFRDLEVGPLLPSESLLLAMHLTGETSAETKARAKSIALDASGSPYFVCALAEAQRTSEETSPDLTLDKVLWERIAALEEKERRLVEVLSVYGQPLRRGAAFQAARLENGAEVMLTRLCASHLARSSGPLASDEIEPFHDRIREVVLEQLPPETLRERHKELATALEREPACDPETLAIHFHGAGNLDKASSYYALAAERAGEALAFARSARLYRLTLELSPPDPGLAMNLQRKLADALANAGRGPEAAEAYLKAAASVDPETALELQRQGAMQCLMSGHIDDGLRVLGTVLDSVGMPLATTPRRALLSLLGNRARLRARGLRFRDRRETSATREARERADICWSVSVGLSIVDTIRAADFQTRSLRYALRAGDARRVARALAWEAAHLTTAGRPARARTERVLATAEALAEEIDDAYVNAILSLTKGIFHYMQGEWRLGLHYSEHAEALFRAHCTGVAWEIDTANSFALWSLFFLGELGELTRRYPLLLREAQERGDRYAATNLGSFAGYLLWIAEDDPKGAADHLAEVMGQWTRQGFHVQHVTELMARVQIDLYRGDAESALSQLDREWSRLRQSLFLRVQTVRVYLHDLRSRAALAVASSGGNNELLLLRAEADARKIQREGLAWSVPLSQLRRASLLATKGETAAAVSLLEIAGMGFESADMQLFALAVRRRIGELLGGREGDALVGSSEQAMRQQCIRNPERIAEMLAPGFAKKKN